MRDLRALSRLASTAARAATTRSGRWTTEVKQRMRESVADSEGASIVDALDFLAHAAPSHSFLADFSEVGLARLRQAGLTLARLRARSTLDLLDFITPRRAGLSARHGNRRERVPPARLRQPGRASSTP